MRWNLMTQLAVLTAASVAPALASDRPPNIVFLYTDDQAAWTLGISGNRDTYTPNLDRFCREGAHLVNAFATTPVCSPARANVMASRYGTEVGITDFLHDGKESDLGLDPAITTWPEVLAAAGYSTALFGKWHLGMQDRYHPTKAGFQKFVGFRGGGMRPKDPTLEVDGEQKVVPGLLIDTLTDHAIRFLREQRDRPFLMCLHYRSPHAPWLPVADEIWDRFKTLDAVIPNPDYPDLDIPRLKKITPEYLASVSSVDDSAGKILAVLDELKLADNTIVVFTSDQGYNMGHNGIWHKGNGHWILKSLRDVPGGDPRVQRPNVYDNSLRVPLAVRWPGVIKPGTVIEQTVTNLDWYPTLVAMAGLDLPKNQIIRGRNFLPLLKGESISWNNDLYAQYSQHHYATTDLRTYRTPKWKLIRDFLNPGKDELYCLDADPAEARNLIESRDPQVTAMRDALHQKLLASMRGIDDPVLARLATQPGAGGR